MKLTDICDIPVIDAHMHVFPDRLYEAIRQWFQTNAWPFDQDGTAESFIQYQFDKGAHGLVVMPYAHRPGIADDLNTFVSDLAGKFKNVKALAAIHPQDQNKRDILNRAFNDLGLCGVKLHCHVQLTAPDDESMYPICESLLEHDKVMVMHAGKEPYSPAYGVDYRTFTGADRVENLLQRFPDLKMIVPHLGFGETERFGELLGEFPNLNLDTTMVLAKFFPVEPDPKFLARYADRIMYGTDFPHIPYPLETELQQLMNMNLDNSDLQKILYENAARFFDMN
jgi:predicted TIM-barrel fold metal-dependent hydrolase